MAGKTIQPPEPKLPKLYQLGNWMAGKTCRVQAWVGLELYQLGNWMAGKTIPVVLRPFQYCTNWGIGWPARRPLGRPPYNRRLYQLGNWMAGKTCACSVACLA